MKAGEEHTHEAESMATGCWNGGHVVHSTPSSPTIPGGHCWQPMVPSEPMERRYWPPRSHEKEADVAYSVTLDCIQGYLAGAGGAEQLASRPQTAFAWPVHALSTRPPGQAVHGAHVASTVAL